MNNGCDTLITDSEKNQPLSSITKENCSIFLANKNPSSSRKQWLLNHLHPSGFIKIDDGANQAIKNNKSLLPAGVIEVGGKFSRGDVISVYSPKKEKIAIGISAYDINEVKKIIGKKSKEIPSILGYEGRDEIIHKDDLVKIIS